MSVLRLLVVLLSVPLHPPSHSEPWLSLFYCPRSGLWPHNRAPEDCTVKIISSHPTSFLRASLIAQLVKNSLQCWRSQFDSWVRKIYWRRIGYPFQYPGLGNSMDCTVHGATKSWTWLSDFHFMKLQNKTKPHSKLILSPSYEFLGERFNQADSGEEPTLASHPQPAGSLRAAPAYPHPAPVRLTLPCEDGIRVLPRLWLLLGCGWGSPSRTAEEGRGWARAPSLQGQWGRLCVYTEAPASLEETLSAGCLGSRSHSLFLPLQDQGVNSLAVANPWALMVSMHPGM